LVSKLEGHPHPSYAEAHCIVKSGISGGYSVPVGICRLFPNTTLSMTTLIAKLFLISRNQHSSASDFSRPRPNVIDVNVQLSRKDRQPEIDNVDVKSWK